MKTIISVFCLLLITQFSIAQSAEKATPPQIITKLKVGDSYTSKKKNIKFLNVITDSRCPSDVTCVWAGQAKIEIGIYENDTLIEKKEMTIGAQGISPDTPIELMELDGKKILGYNLSPYPSSKNKISTTDYFLELLIK